MHYSGLQLVLITILYDADAGYLSYGKSATSSSVSKVYASDLVSLTDGQDSVAGWMNQCFSTGGDSSEWIRIDLGYDYNVTMVTVINAVSIADDGIAEQLLNAMLKIGTSKQCGEKVTSVSESPILDFICDPPLNGRYVDLYVNNAFSVCEVRVYGQNDDFQTIDEELTPVSVWPLNKLCGISDASSLAYNPDHQYDYITDHLYVSDGAFELSGTVETVQLISQYEYRSVSAMSLTVNVYPFGNASHGVVLRMSSKFTIRLSMVYNIIHMSEVVIACDGDQLIRVNILKPKTWTFLGLTFDGNARKLTIWRDGEIVNTTSTSFDAIHMNFGEVVIAPAATVMSGQAGSHMGFSRLQLFNRALNELEMKAYRDDIKVSKCSGVAMFQSQTTTDSKDSTWSSDDSYRITTTTRVSRILCAHECLREHTCLYFDYGGIDAKCSLYWSPDLSTTDINSGFYKLIN